MRVRSLMMCMAAALGVGTNALAAIVIPTNQNGADAEIRESEINSGGELDPAVFATHQRGAANELATRGMNRADTAASNDRSSIMYMKFDISGLPNHNSDPGFWANNEVVFRGFVRNTSLSDGRLIDKIQSGADLPPEQWERVKFNVMGLEPGHVYADDVGGSTTKTDRSGNSFESPHYMYDWPEGIGTGGNNQDSGITYLSAPGITPFCTEEGTCADAYGDTNPANFHKTLGVYDDFNEDARMLGEWEWPVAEYALNGASRYPVGMPLDYRDENGNLEQLIFDAQDAGRDKVTLMLHLAVDTLEESAGGRFSTSDFLNFNYLWNPKEKTTLENDNSWDPDGSGPLLATGSPWSCDGSSGAGQTNCPMGTLGSNANGEFSPQLIVRVPEPASMAMLVLGALAIGLVRRK